MNNKLDAIAYWSNITSEYGEIDAFHMGRYKRTQKFPSSAGSDRRYRLLAEEARIGSLRDDRPYWDLLLHIAAQKGELTEDLLARASKSHPSKMQLLPVSASEIRAGALRLVAQCSIDQVIVIASRVTLVNGQMKHFPMMDLRCGEGDVPLHSVKRLANWLLPGGYALFASGRSYHLVGTEPVSASALSKFLVRSLYAGDLIDRKYVAHHLERGFCTLRISRSAQGSCPVWIQQ